MEMQGSIQEFSVPEILQFLSLHEADGVLRLRAGREVVHFGMKNGKITDATYRGKETFYSIDEYIQRTGMISSEKLEEYRKKAKELDISTLDYLIQEGIFEEEEFERIISFKIQEIIDEVLTWDDGNYSFEAGKSLYKESGYSVRLDSNSLVMEGMRRIDEWPQIKSVIPDSNYSLSLKGEPHIDVEMGKDEETVLDKFEEGITVEELVKVSGLGKFQTYNSVYKLIELGVLEITEKSERKPEKKVKAKKVNFRNVITRLILVVFILANVFFLFKFKIEKFVHFREMIVNFIKLIFS